MTCQQQENAGHSIKNHLKTNQGSRDCQGKEALGKVRDTEAGFALKDLVNPGKFRCLF